MNEIQYDKIRNELKTGDLILFSGESFVAMCIKLISKSIYSHIGMVIRVEELDMVAIWESTPVKAKDISSGNRKSGVRMTPLSECVKNSSGKIVVRKLQEVEFGQERISKLKAFRREFSKKSYDFDAVELFKSAYDGWGGKNEEDLSNFFCSELVAETYQAMGLLDESKPSNEYVPGDFSRERDLRLLEGSLGEEITLRYDH